MTCPKCASLMVSEEFTDYQQTGQYTFTGWRCVSCGLILDPVILGHLTERNREQKVASSKEVLAEVGSS